MSLVIRNTPNYNLRIINYDVPQWHVPSNENIDIIDAVMGLFARVANIRGIWANATAYSANDRVVDIVTGFFYETSSTHTSSSTGTFAETRAASPSLWTQVEAFDVSGFDYISGAGASTANNIVVFANGNGDAILDSGVNINAISTLTPVIKTAVAWAADTTTILLSGRIGIESDTGKFKFGNGIDLWSGLDYAVGESGSGHDEVTLANTQPSGKTASFTLGADETIKTLNDQILIDGRFVNVDPAANVDITLNPAFNVGEEWLIRVVDEDHVTTLVRASPQISFGGTTTNGSVNITNIDDKTGIENGYTYVGSNFPGGTTVVDKDLGVNSIEMSANATVSGPDIEIILDAGKQGTINGVQGDLVLRKGLTFVKLIGNAFGADVEARGDIAGGGGPFTQESITATGNTNLAGIYFGKSVLIKSASGTPTFTFLTEANYGNVIQPGTWIKFFFDGVASSFTFVQGSGTTLLYPASQTLAMIDLGTVTAEYLGSETWVLSGALIAS